VRSAGPPKTLVPISFSIALHSPAPNPSSCIFPPKYKTEKAPPSPTPPILDSLKVPLRNLRRRSQEFLSGKKSEKSSSTPNGTAKGVKSSAQPAAQANGTAAAAQSTAKSTSTTTEQAPQIADPQTMVTSTMNGTASYEANVPSYLLTGKVAIVTGSGKSASRAVSKSRAPNTRHF
jgi:hypothetical protein